MTDLIKQDAVALSKQNPRIDLKVAKDFERLAREAPLTGALKKGADYNLTHPMDSTILRSQHNERKVDGPEHGCR